MRDNKPYWLEQWVTFYGGIPYIFYGCKAVRASWSVTEEEGEKQIKWLNDRHEEVKKLSILQGFDAVKI